MIFGEALYCFLKFVMDRMVWVMGRWICSIMVMMYFRVCDDIFDTLLLYIG